VNKLILSILCLFSLNTFAFFEPRTIKDFHNTSVRIYNLEENSGGSGSVYRSYKNASYILTNKHICRLIEPGGLVEHNGVKFLITHYKKFPQHDLCLIRIPVNLQINLQIANTLSETSDIAIVSGHPNLLPHILTKGHLSDRMDIQLITGIKKCTPEDLTNDPMKCAWFGGNPVIETFDSQVVSNLIKPGSSGSAVFNTLGQLIGVIYAGSGRDFSHGFIVPHIYLLYFTQNLDKFDWVKVGTPVDEGDFTDRIFNYNKCKSIELEINKRLKPIKDLCKKIQDNVIGTK